jgi:YHS domain-containing protein
MKRIIFIYWLIVTISFSYAQDNVALRLKHFNVQNTIALQKYDAVSYFSSKPIKGANTYQYTYNGIIYYFSTAENLQTFKNNPAKYEPAYGGWCAYAMGVKGEKVEVDPFTYKIIQGKLYLFYNKYFNNTRTDWNEDEINIKQKADLNWSKIITK